MWCVCQDQGCRLGRTCVIADHCCVTCPSGYGCGPELCVCRGCSGRWLAGRSHMLVYAVVFWSVGCVPSMRCGLHSRPCGRPLTSCHARPQSDGVYGLAFSIPSVVEGPWTCCAASPYLCMRRPYQAPLWPQLAVCIFFSAAARHPSDSTTECKA